MINENIKLKGTYHMKIYRRLERWQDRMWLRFLRFFSKKSVLPFLERVGITRDAWNVDNLIVSAGKAQVALLIGDASAVPFTYAAVGTSTTAVSAGQTALAAEISDTGLARAAGTVTRTTTTVTNDTYQLSYTWTASGSKTVEEVGIFNASSSGTMLSRALTGTKTLSNGETLALVYTCAFA